MRYEGGLGAKPGPPPPLPPPASPPIFKDIFIYAWTIYLGSIVKFNAFYEYCGLFCMSAMRVGSEDSCGWRYDDRK